METFGDNKILVYHQRLPEPCALAEWVLDDEGCDEEQKEKIRKGDKGDDHTRWKRMFRILFPHVDESAVPDGIVHDTNNINNTNHNTNAYFVSPVAMDPGLNVPWQGEEAATAAVAEQESEGVV